MSERPPREALNDLDARLRRAREASEPTELARRARGGDPPQGALGLALRLGVEMVSALVVGTAIGWGLDHVFGTRPWIMLVFILLGGAAGILNVYRLARGFGYAAGYKKDVDSTTNGDGGR